VRPGDLETCPNHPLKPRHLKLHDLFCDAQWRGYDVVTGRRLVLGNADVRISYVVAGTPSPLYRSAVGDECVFVESGSRVWRRSSGRSRRGPGTTS